MSKPYIGSVRFYVHLYTCIFVLLLVSPIIGGFWYYQKSQASNIPENEQKVENIVVTKQASFDYQSKYPNLYVPVEARQPLAANTIYLTFDDGPSPCTEKILDVLKQNDVKATFFVIGKVLDQPDAQQTLKRIVAEGHTLGIHSETHNYRQIYASVDAYLADFAKLENRIYQITGEHPTIFRYPGGSINIYNVAIWQNLIAEMTRRGYVHFDWNISNGDATTVTQLKSDVLIDNVLTKIPSYGSHIVLMHDSAVKTETVKSLATIIARLKARGFNFNRLTNKDAPVSFGYTRV